MSTELSMEAVPLSTLPFGSKLKYFFCTLFKTVFLSSIFALLLFMKYFWMSIFDGYSIDSMLSSVVAVGATILVYSVIFLIYYIISEHVIKQMISGIIISIIGCVISAFFPPVGIIIAVIGIFSMIRQFISFVQMIPMLLLGVLILVLLYLDIIVADFAENANLDISKLNLTGFTFTGNSISFSIGRLLYPYCLVSFLVSLNLSMKYSLKNAMLRQVVLLMAIPIISLMVWLIKTTLANAFYNPQEIQSAQISKGKIFVKPYTKANGTFVQGYWRKAPSFY